MKIYSEILIAAPVQQVWKEFTDFENWSEWNPFITNIEPEPSAGSKISVLIDPPGGKAMVFKPRVLVYEKERELRWLGRVLLPGLFDGEHFFRLRETGGGTLFIQGEQFSGILLPLLKKSLSGVEQGFHAMNAALKARCEAAG